MKRTVSVTIAAIAGLGSAYWVWRRWSNTLPAYKTPIPKLPSPNAYDFYGEAGRAFVPSQFDAVINKPTMPPTGLWHRGAIEDREAWLQENAKALSLIRRGLTYPCHAPWIFDDSKSELRDLMPPLAKLLIVESQVHMHHRNWGAAANSILDALTFGFELSHGGITADWLLSAAIARTALNDMWFYIGFLDLQEAKQIYQRWEQTLSRQPSYVSLLLREKEVSQKAISLFPKLSKAEKRDIEKKIKQRLFNAPLRKVYREHMFYMDRLIAQAHLTYSAPLNLPSIPHNGFSQFSLPLHEKTRWFNALWETKNSFLSIDLALHIYKLEHNHYPENLQSLVPHYISQIPADPFGKGEPLSYKLTEFGYKLYSVGPDGQDDNGQAIENMDLSPNSLCTRVVTVKSKGDIVAGFNE